MESNITLHSQLVLGGKVKTIPNLDPKKKEVHGSIN